MQHKTLPVLRTVVAIAALAASGATAIAQSGGINARFEPGCDQITGFFTHDGPPAAGYTWDFGDGTLVHVPGPLHRFAFGAPLNVSLTLFYPGGITTTYAQTYGAQEQADLTMLEPPTVFTPNGDGHNDTFSPTPDEFLGACSELNIFNRMGQLVFRNSGNDLTWDGRTMAGEPVTDGTYFYVFTVRGMEFKGPISLFR